MLSVLGAPLAFVFIFGMVVFVHELGHFLAAKATGVYAPRFSIGFGSALWSRRWGETEYVLAAFPLGGYVRMASREDESMAAIEGGGEQPATDGASSVRPAHYDPNGMAPFGPRPVPTDRLFESKSLPARLFIMSAGVTMNMVLGFVVLTALAYHTGVAFTRTRTVGGLQPVAAAPQLAQLVVGDTILAIDGKPVANWNAIEAALGNGAGKAIAIRTQRGEVSIPVGGPGQATRSQIDNAIIPLLPTVIDFVAQGKPAERAGLRAGDSVVAIDGTPVRAWHEVVSQIERSPGRPLHFEVVRQDSTHTFAVVPESTPQANPITGVDEVVGKIQASNRTPTDFAPVSLWTATYVGWRNTWYFAGSIVTTVKRLFVGRESVKNLEGPIGILRASAAAAQTGFAQVLLLLAVISINVAVFNLLPLPILDGGQITLNILESAKGSSFSLRTRETLAKVGITAIALLFLYVTYNDLLRAYGALMSWVQSRSGG